MIKKRARHACAAKNQTPYMVENQWYSNDLSQSIIPGRSTRR